MFLINNRDYLALRYNGSFKLINKKEASSMIYLYIKDKSVLESHHIAKTFLIMTEEKFNIFENFSKENIKKTREQMISMVIATDMSFHFPNLKVIEGKVGNKGIY
jgi:hypothetical protein